MQRKEQVLGSKTGNCFTRAGQQGGQEVERLRIRAKIDHGVESVSLTRTSYLKRGEEDVILPYN